MMDDSELALEQAIYNMEMEEESSDSDEDSSQAGREESEITSESERLYRCPPPQPLCPREESRSISVSVSTSCVSEPPISLKTIIEDDRTFLMFRRFLKDQCITRNLNFWLACEHYRTLPPDSPDRLRDVAQAIYAKFIKCSAPQRVTILDRTKKQIKMSLEYRIPLTPSLFQGAQKEIWRIMEKNEMRQFLVSDAFADCSVFTNLESTLLAAAIYSPSMAQPAYGVCGGGSLQQSGSEDSASLTSSSDAPGMRSAVARQLTRPFPSANRNAMSDTEGSRHQKAPSTGPHITKDRPISQEDFVAMVTERLLAVLKDRDAMRRRAQDRGRQQGRTFEEIMALDWYDLPESFKYVNFRTDSSIPPSTGELQDSHLRPSSVKHVLSPVKTSLSPYSTPTPSLKQQHQQPPKSHINSLAMREVQDALKDLEITNKVHKKQRSLTGSGCGSSILSTTSDSGVGDTWATSGLVTPSANDRLQAYLQRQKILATSMPEREVQAQAAAIALISNSPHPDALNPQVPPITVSEGSERQRRPQFVRNFPNAYSSDDSSSCFTMTSQSSTSDLFIPRRIPHPHSVYSDSDEPHHYGSRYHRRQLSTPRRSHQLSHKHTPPGPPIAEQRVGPPQRHNGDILVVYHLDDFPTPYAKRISSTDLTLGTFKEKVFARKGDYRFFFKRYCEDLGMEIMEEYSDDIVTLPLTQGKIIGRVEKAT